MADTKIHINLQQGILEVEGSEKFVENIYSDFKENLNEKAVPQKPAGNVDALKYKDPVSELPIKKFTRVFHIEGTNVKIIKKMPGSNNSTKSVNTALAYLWAKKSVGVEEVPLKEIRDMCQDQGCLDANNFAAHMKSAKAYIIIDGKKSSNTKTSKLTLPGVEYAEQKLEELNGEKS